MVCSCHDAGYDEWLNQLPMISNPHGTAMNNTLQQVSGAIGSALLLTIMTKRMETVGADLMAETIASGMYRQQQRAGNFGTTN